MATITREPTPLRPEHVGLTLRDGKTVLSAIQRAVVTDQVEVEAAAWWICPHCHQRKRIKDRRRRRVRTTFGEVEVSVAAITVARASAADRASSGRWVGDADAGTPEYAYLLAKWGEPHAVSPGDELDAGVAPAASI